MLGRGQRWCGSSFMSNQGLRPSPQDSKPNYDLFLTLMGICDAFLFGNCSVHFYSLLLTRQGYDDNCNKKNK